MSRQGRRKEKVKEKVCKDLVQLMIAGAHAFDNYKSSFEIQNYSYISTYSFQLSIDLCFPNNSAIDSCTKFLSLVILVCSV